MTILNRNKKVTIHEMLSSTLRSDFGFLKNSLFGRSTPTNSKLRHSRVNADDARTVYFNLDPSMKYGSIFAKPIVNVCANFIGLPTLNCGDENLDKLLNDHVTKYWPVQLLQAYRESMRDVRVWLRLRKPTPSPLVSLEESNTVQLEVIPDDRVVAFHNPVNGQLERIECLYSVLQEEEPFDINQVASGFATRTREHEIVEIITTDSYRYFDKTTNTELTNYQVNNDWGFIPFVPLVNEPDSTLGNEGQSDLENVFPFLQAFHDVVDQVRSAHKYHSIPKAYFRLDDVMGFLKNNFPDAFDAEGNFTHQVTWEGREIFFMEQDDQPGFLEARSVIGDSTILMQFIFNCICVASETPSWAFMWIHEVANQGNITPQTLPFKNRIERKRENIISVFQELGKMALVITGNSPVRADVNWHPVETADLAAEAQALNLVVTAAEVANRAGVITRSTYRSKIKQFFPAMDTTQLEDQNAQAELIAEEQRKIDQEIQLSKAQAALKPTPTPASTKKNGNAPINSPSRGRGRIPVVPTPSGS